MQNIYDDQEVFHDSNPKDVLKRLNGFYGKVAGKQNELIISKIAGKKVLDIGSGYGFLLKHLKEYGFNALGIEPAPKELEFSRKWWGVDVVEGSAYDLSKVENDFDTVVLRDVIFHLDAEQVIPEIKKINKKRVIVFMGNTGWLLLMAKWLLRHKEHHVKKAKDYMADFNKYGYECKDVIYSDYFAFPLSGGFISLRLVPNIEWIMSFVLAMEKFFAKLFKLLRLQKVFAYRVMLVFDKE